MPIDATLENLQPGEWVARRFEIRDGLGGGPGYFAYRAYDREAKGWVSLRLLLPEFLADAPARSAFLHTVAAGVAAPHPNLLSLRAHGVEDGVDWVAFGWIETVALVDILHSRSCLGWAEVGWLLQFLCSACEHVARLGLVGLDLTPRTTLIARATSPEDRRSVPEGVLTTALFDLHDARVVYAPLFASELASAAGNYAFQPANLPESIRAVVGLVCDLLGRPPRNLRMPAPPVVTTQGEAENALLRKVWSRPGAFTLREFIAEFQSIPHGE